MAKGNHPKGCHICLDGVVWNAHTKAACNIRARLHNVISSWRRYREVKALLAERTRNAEGTVHPELGFLARKRAPINRERITITL